MKKSILVCFVLIILFAQNVSSQQLGDTYTDKSGVFSISMPRGWQTIDVGMKYQGIAGPAEGGITPNMSFIDEAFSGAVSAYIDAALVQLPLIFQGFTLLNRNSFRTNAGITGESMTYIMTMGTVRMRVKQYVLPNRNGTMVMVISCGAPVNAERYDAFYDSVARTFNWR